MSLVLLFTTLALGGEPHNDRITANAGEIPALASLLDKTGWQATPELTGGIRPGDIFSVSEQRHVLEGSRCVEAEVRESTYTQVELVSELQSGVRVRFLGLGKAEAQHDLVKHLKFSTPTHQAIPGFDLVLSSDCLEAAQRTDPAERGQMYVVREVLMAEIAEQTCGRIDAEGRFVGLGDADADLKTACRQLTVGPVAVGYRTKPLTDLLETSGPSPEEPYSDPISYDPHWSGLSAPVMHMGQARYRDGLGDMSDLDALEPLLIGNGGSWLLDQHERAQRGANNGMVMTLVGTAAWITGAAMLGSSCDDFDGWTCGASMALNATGGTAMVVGGIWWGADGTKVGRTRRAIANDATAALIPSSAQYAAP